MMSAGLIVPTIMYQVMYEHQDRFSNPFWVAFMGGIVSGMYYIHLAHLTERIFFGTLTSKKWWD